MIREGRKRRRALGGPMQWPTIAEQEEVFGSRALAAIQILRGAASYVGIAGPQPEATYIDPDEALRHATYQYQQEQARARRAWWRERNRQRRATVRPVRAALYRLHESGPGTGTPRSDGQMTNARIFQIERLILGVWHRDSVGYSTRAAAEARMRQNHERSA